MTKSNGKRCTVGRCREAVVVCQEFLVGDKVCKLALCQRHADRWRQSEFACRSAMQAAGWVRLAAKERKFSSREKLTAETVNGQRREG